MTDYPDDLAVGFKQPCVFLSGIVKFEFIEKVTHEFSAFHAKGADAVTLAPMAHNDAFAVKQSGVEGNVETIGAHPW